MIIPKTVPILEDIDDRDDDVQVSFSVDGEVESIKYSGYGYGHSETARVCVQTRFEEPAVGYPYSHNEWETTKHFRNGKGRGALFRDLQLARAKEAETKRKALLEKEDARKELLRLAEEALEWRRKTYLASLRTCRGIRDTPVESLLLKATYKRRLVGTDAPGVLVGQNVWGFTDPRSFKFLLKEDPYTTLGDFVRLPPDKHEKLRKLCYEGDVAVSRKVWCEMTIDGIDWHYDVELEFRQLENRQEPVSEFYVIEELGIGNYVI